MKYRFFAVSALNPEVGEDALNLFCAGHRVVAVEKQFIADGDRSFWSICVGYQDSGAEIPAQQRRPRVDYRAILSEEDFAVYVVLRNLRKELADKEGVPAYALFTNEQLADMVRRRVDSVTALAELDGIGAARVEKYGEAFVAALREAFAKAPPPADAPRSH